LDACRSILFIGLLLVSEYEVVPSSLQYLTTRYDIRCI